MSPRTRRADRRDRGAVLPLVLVLTVIAALLVVPLMTYAMAIGRANGVLSDSTAQMEAVRAGARIALADPLELFDRCDTEAPVALPMPTLDLPIETTCRQVADVGVVDPAAVPDAAVTLQLGATVPSWFRGTASQPPAGATPAWWWDAASPEPVSGTVWLPDLPIRVTSQPDPTGYPMPASFGSCTVFFPGTYDTPIVLNGPTYFASGDYTFLDDVVVVGGADVVAGYGLTAGCADDIQAVLDLEAEPPAQYNISGGGATWILGGDARLVVDNRVTVDSTGALVANDAGLPLRLAINRRYVDAPDAPNARVSIATVNGDAAAGDLVVPDLLAVPSSRVATPSGPIGAVEHGYVPSTVTPLAAVPAAVVDIDVSGTAAASVSISGYTAVPQGSVRVANPMGHDVRVVGGVVAASFDVVEPSSIVGFVDVVLQRTVVVETTAGGSVMSTLTAQINESGVFEVNSWVIQ